MLPPFRILFQQHLPSGIRRPKRVQHYVAPPPPVLKEGWVMNPVYGPVRRGPGMLNTDILQGKNLLVRGMLNARRYKREQERVKAAVVAGNLLYQDFRFFVGSKSETSRFSRCRGCRMVLIGQGERKKHMETTKHTVWLTKSFEMLNMSKAAVDTIPVTQRECVVCARAVTGAGIWGVPLCRQERCIERWMYDDDMPSASLIAALAKSWPHLQHLGVKNAE